MKKEAEELFIQDPVARNRTGRINYNKKKESYLLLYYKGKPTQSTSATKKVSTVANILHAACTEIRADALATGVRLVEFF